MAIKQDYNNWKSHTDEKGILWLAIDRHASSVNSLNQEVLSELDNILDEVASNTSVNCIIIYSAKKTGFIAGADISQFTDLKSTDEAFNLIRQGQLVFEKLAALTKPTVAMIDGFCLGGGLELALACWYRVAENSAHTKLGFPEVMLGIHPGWRGTVLLPCLIGAPKAMRLIATGKILSAEEAVKLGVIDAAVPRRVLENAAQDYALKCPKRHQPTFLEGLTNYGLVRPLLAKLFYAKLREKIKENHYPAPFAVIRNWEEVDPASASATIQEAKSISKLMTHPTSRNLVRVFFLKERLKGLAKGLSFKPQRVHVVGAGTMGSAIAAWCALSQLNVTLQDNSPELMAAAMKKAHHIIKNKLKHSREILLAMDRLNPDIEGLGIAKADIIIEAIVENLEAKQDLYRTLESQMKSGALLVTNTSSLPLSELRKALKNPALLVGLHFFNPVDKMDLVEVVSDSETDPDRVKDAIAFVKRINKLPLPVKSRPGFLVNRVLMPYLLESIILLEEGVPERVIDQAAKDFGMPMGPLELADRVGLDVCLSVAEILTHYLGGEVPTKLRSMVAENKLGVKSGEGFYKYRDGQLLKPPTKSDGFKISSADLVDRLILRMLNESAACLRESIVSDADLLDAGMIFGTGFAPFLGGPLHYVKTRGMEQIKQRLEQLADQYGERFKPDRSWQGEEESMNRVRGEGSIHFQTETSIH
jgi:3-hydroxyacyl-CoA dehydrogenase/enoyl-CoA hydratase/3-hydroxybutyryl-CoA epimerase